MQRPGFAFEGVVRITRIGIAYLIFTFFLGLAALNTGNNSLYIAGSLMLATLLVSGLLSWRALRRIDIAFESTDTAWAGAPVRGELRVTNASRWISPRDVVLVSSQLERPVLIDEVRKRSSRVVPISFLFTSRGRTHFENVDLYCRYPFGLFLKKWSRPLEGDVIVLPRLLDGEDDGSMPPENRGLTDFNARADTGSDLYGFREYSPGDSLRQVNWKKSARIGRWILRQPQAERDVRLHVAVDPWLPSSRDRDLLETEISRAATLIHSTPGSVTLHLPGRSIQSRRMGKISLLEALALLETSPERRQLLVPHGTRVFGVEREVRRGPAVA